MALIYLERLPELKQPLDYPECLNRIVKVAENRAVFEIAKFRQSDLFMKQDWLTQRHWGFLLKPNPFILLDCTV